MKKSMLKKMKRFTALAVGATLLLQSVAFANPAPTHLQGTGTVVNPVFSVLLPTAPAIRINPLQIGSTVDTQGAPVITEPQVSSAWNVIANRSNVPVNIAMRVAPSTTAVAATQATFVENLATHLALDATPDDARAVQLAIEFANAAPTTNRTGVAGEPVFTNAATAVQLGNLNWTVQADPGPASETLTIAPGAGVGAAMQFGHNFNIVLSPHRYNDLTPAGTQTIYAGPMTPTQYTAFRFNGEVNSAATWAAGSVTARIVFTITPISILDYADHLTATATTGTVITGAHRVFNVENSTPQP